MSTGLIIGRGHTGWRLLRVMQTEPETRDIPVIICTGAVQQVTELSDHLEKMGVRADIKPFDIDDLLAVIAQTWRSALDDT